MRARRRGSRPCIWRPRAPMVSPGGTACSCCCGQKPSWIWETRRAGRQCTAPPATGRRQPSAAWPARAPGWTSSRWQATRRLRWRCSWGRAGAAPPACWLSSWKRRAARQAPLRLLPTSTAQRSRRRASPRRRQRQRCRHSQQAQRCRRRGRRSQLRSPWRRLHYRARLPPRPWLQAPAR